MTILLSDIHLPMLIKTTLSESPYKSVPWNNLDQLSCLWGAFTKCKKNIQDGFRLENLSWRLWYRQSVLQKKAETKTLNEMDFTSKEKLLNRTKSLPDLSQWSHKKNFRTHQSSQKFFIPAITETTEQDEQDEHDEHDEHDEYDESEEEEEPIEEVSLTFTKKTNNALSKPISLLSDMLIENNSGLRRCQSRYSRLDEYFLNANTTTSV